MKKKNYHHGNLREALIDAAHRILAEEGLESLSLRKVAQQAGVSAPALYSHFKDKRELMSVLATQGFEWLTASMMDAAGKQDSDGGEGEPGLSGLAQGYVAFSIENGALFQLMFGREVGELLDSPALIEAGSRCYGLMADSVAAHLRQTGAPGNPVVAATAAWSMVHGLATLIHDGRVSPASCGASSNEELVMQVFQTFRFANPETD